MGFNDFSPALDSIRESRFGRTALAVLLCAALAAPAVLGGCSGSGSGSNGSGSGSATNYTAENGGIAAITQDDYRNVDLGNGWEPVDQLELQYATHFSVDYFEGGYKLLCLSDGSRFLTIPEGAAKPEGLASDIVCLQLPLDSTYLVSSGIMCLYDTLGIMDSISVSGILRDNWSVQAAVDAMDAGKIVYGGKYNAPDYDLLLTKGVDVAMENTMVLHNPDVKEKLEALGIPVVIERSTYELNPLGRTEWVKFFGALYDKEAEAIAAFDEQNALAKAAEDLEASGKTVAFFYINSNGAAVVRRPGDYVTRMIELAGGVYVFDHLDDSNTAQSTATLEMESFYATAKDADVIIYNGTIDGGIASVSQLVEKNKLLANFKAVKEGNVWCTDQDMYQQMMRTGIIINEMNTAFSGASEEKLTYLVHLK